MYQDEPTDDVIVDNTDDGVTVNVDGSTGAAPEQQTHVDETDDKGVSYKNRYFELERKFENLNKSIPQMIQEAAQVSAQSVATQHKSNEPDYSVSDYVAAKHKDPANAAYYDSKIEELKEKRVSQTIKQELSSFQREQQTIAARSQAENWAYQNFPQLRDQNSALYQQTLAFFNSRPADKREAYDFAIAAELAASRMGIKPVQAINPQQEALLKKERELKKLNKERAIEGDGKGTISTNAITQRAKDLDDALKTGGVRGYLEKYYVNTKKVAE